MNYYISETHVDESQARTAGSKARDDVQTVFQKKGMTAIQVAVMQNDRKEQRNIISKLKFIDKFIMNGRKKQKYFQVEIFCLFSFRV